MGTPRFWSNTPSPAPPAAGAGPPLRQLLYWWRLDKLTAGAEHETSAGSAAGDGDGRVWGPVAVLEKLGAGIQRNDNSEVVGVYLYRTQVTDAGRRRTAEAVSEFVGHHVKTRGKNGDASC